MPDSARGAELAALTEIASQVNCTQDLDEILSGALQTTLQVIGADAGEVFLFDEQTGELFLHAQQGTSEAFIAQEAVVGPGECICGLSAESRSLVVAGDIASHPARSRAACLREGFRSLLCLPILARGHVLGLLNVQCRTPRQFTEQDEELLTAIGNQIGIAIANAQLIDDAEQRRSTLHSVMNSLVDGLILVDKRGRIAFANPRAGEMLGISPGTLVGATMELLDQRLDTSLTAAAGAANPATLEISLDAPAESTLQARFFPVHDASGDSPRLGLLLRDITRERELDEMKSQLLATVSHELRTPLASIKGFATTLLRQDVDWDEDSRRDFLGIIDAESDRLSELISNLLDMSRIEAGTLRVDPEATDLIPIVEETVDEFRNTTSVHIFRVSVPSNLPTVHADPRRVRQVMRNLAENAVKYSPEGGPIEVSAQTLVDRIRVSVADQGLGIERDQIDRVFDRFYQVDSASTRQTGGSGLGLSICKAIIQAHDGRIWVESEPGKGSTFHFTLPLEENGSE